MWKISDLKEKHPRIYAKLIGYQGAQGHRINDNIPVTAGITTSLTEEGPEIWDDVEMGNFQTWYEFHQSKLMAPKPGEYIVAAVIGKVLDPHSGIPEEALLTLGEAKHIKACVKNLIDEHLKTRELKGKTKLI